VDPRRLEQLDRARKLEANVSVLLGQGDEAPTIIELGRVSRTALANSARIHVQVLSWTDVARYASIPVHHGATEAQLADAVDRALDRFEDGPPSRSVTQVEN
jgi:hypothetical protein